MSTSTASPDNQPGFAEQNPNDYFVVGGVSYPKYPLYDAFNYALQTRAHQSEQQHQIQARNLPQVKREIESLGSTLGSWSPRINVVDNPSIPYTHLSYEVPGVSISSLKLYAVQSPQTTGTWIVLKGHRTLIPQGHLTSTPTRLQVGKDLNDTAFDQPPGVRNTNSPAPMLANTNTSQSTNPPCPRIIAQNWKAGNMPSTSAPAAIPTMQSTSSRFPQSDIRSTSPNRVTGDDPNDPLSTLHHQQQPVATTTTTATSFLTHEITGGPLYRAFHSKRELDPRMVRAQLESGLLSVSIRWKPDVEERVDVAVELTQYLDSLVGSTIDSKFNDNTNNAQAPAPNPREVVLPSLNWTAIPIAIPRYVVKAPAPPVIPTKPTVTAARDMEKLASVAAWVDEQKQSEGGVQRVARRMGRLSASPPRGRPVPQWTALPLNDIANDEDVKMR